MGYGAIDLHKRESQVRIVTDEGEVIDRRIATTRDSFRHLFWGRPCMRVLIEASTESEWVAQHLESLGHEAIVADPNYTLMYGHRTRRIKTDRRDVAALTEACRLQIYRPVHRRSADHVTIQWQLNVRQQLVWMRTRAISLMRATTRGVGVHIRSSDTDHFLTHLEHAELPTPLQDALAPLREQLRLLNTQLAEMDAVIGQVAQGHPVIRRLLTCPGVGPVTATAYVAALDTVERFPSAGHVTSYLGLVPREYSSEEHQRRGHIVRAAHPRVQSLLVQAAVRVRRSRREESGALRAWALGIERRRGTTIAVVALARRLARILFAMWRDGVDYQPRLSRGDKPAGLASV
jgi:transposase